MSAITAKLTWLWDRVDKFILAITIAAIVGSIFPATGSAAPVADWAVKILIAVLFFLYGARLKPTEVIAGLKHWRLHSVILGFTFVIFPMIGLSLRWLTPTFISHSMYLGLLYMCLTPSTVQSSINFTTIAKGNVPGAIVSASTSNILGVFLTPILAFLTMGVAGEIKFNTSMMVDLTMQIVVPFIIGQLSRPWTADFVARNKAWLKYVDQGAIVLVVYSAFSIGRREDIWAEVTGREIWVITVILLLLLWFVLWLTWHVAGWLKFSREDRIAIQFCGTKKSLATGFPMATVMFPGGQASIITLPLMIFHMAQLIACQVLAEHYGRTANKLAISQSVTEQRAEGSLAEGPATENN